MFLLSLRAVIQHIVVRKTEQLDDKSQTFENVIQIARKEDEAYRARLMKPFQNREVLYSSLNHERKAIIKDG